MVHTTTVSTPASSKNCREPASENLETPITLPTPALRSRTARLGPIFPAAPRTTTGLGSWPAAAAASRLRSGVVISSSSSASLRKEERVGGGGPFATAAAGGATIWELRLFSRFITQGTPRLRARRPRAAGAARTVRGRACAPCVRAAWPPTGGRRAAPRARRGGCALAAAHSPADDSCAVVFVFRPVLLRLLSAVLCSLPVLL
jgi:hypothetical protein